jgi:hypothetical protein
MNGPEHFLEAERLLDLSVRTDTQHYVPLAAVHAQLAQIAASVVRVSGGCQETVGVSEWLRVLAPTET